LRFVGPGPRILTFASDPLLDFGEAVGSDLFAGLEVRDVVNFTLAALLVRKPPAAEQE
jgi:hypothetical protein